MLSWNRRGEERLWHYEYNASRNHQVESARHNIEDLFTDKTERYEKVKPYRRDRRVPIPGPKECRRCGSIEDLQRDHIRRLTDGGKDNSQNLRWLCRICHHFRHAEDEVLKDLENMKMKYGVLHWKYRLTAYRLKVLRELNPPGADGYTSYWDDPKTHYDYWYRRYMPKGAKLSDEEKIGQTILDATTIRMSS